MVSLDLIQMQPSKLSATIIFPTPKPVVIFTDKSIMEWEELFKELMDNSSNLTEKHDYDQCYSTLKWARFCNANNIALRVGRNANGHTVEIKFFFTSYNHLSLFFNELNKVLEGIMLY